MAKVMACGQQKIKKLKIKGRSSGSGSECTFYKTKRLGYKVYHSYNDISEVFDAFNKQKKAYRAGIAPKPGYIFITNDNQIGYTTQLAKPIRSSINWNIFDNQVGKLEDKMIKLGLSTCDVHEDNCGVINGRLVCIDFGSMST